MLAGIVWMLENPQSGIVEADEMNFRRCLEIQLPYLGNVFGNTPTAPLVDRSVLFPETVDERFLAVLKCASSVTLDQDINQAVASVISVGVLRN